ncbi:MAG: hypothetical protein ACK5H1_06790 [Tenacibaculum sp.]
MKIIPLLLILISAIPKILTRINANSLFVFLKAADSSKTLTAIFSKKRLLAYSLKEKQIYKYTEAWKLLKASVKQIVDIIITRSINASSRVIKVILTSLTKNNDDIIITPFLLKNTSYFRI